MGTSFPLRIARACAGFLIVTGSVIAGGAANLHHASAYVPCAGTLHWGPVGPTYGSPNDQYWSYATSNSQTEYDAHGNACYFRAWAYLYLYPTEPGSATLYSVVNNGQYYNSSRRIDPGHRGGVWSPTVPCGSQAFADATFWVGGAFREVTAQAPAC